MEEINNPIEAQDASKQTDQNTFKFSSVPLLTDYLLRWLVFELWNYGFINGFVFWTGQILIAVGVFIFTMDRYTRIQTKHNITETYTEDSTWSVFLVFFIIFSGTAVTFSLYPNWPLWLRVIWATIIFLVYGFYSGVMYVFSLQSNSKARYTQEYEALANDTQIPVDANDIRIIRMETEIASISNRIESFTLESALFGALAFSGFLTLIAGEKPILKNTQDFIANLTAIIYAVRDFDLNSAKGTLAVISTSDCLLGAIATQTLVCSMFFVSVIVSRLRFYNTLKKVDYAIRVARGYNDKEEQAYLILLEQQNKGGIADPEQVQPSDTQYLIGPSIPENLASRLEHLTDNVTNAINNADPLFRDLIFVTTFIWGLRNLGIIAFVLILLTSALLLSHTLAFLFLVLFSSALLYTVLDGWFRNKKLRGNPFFLALEKRIFRIKENKKK